MVAYMDAESLSCRHVLWGIFPTFLTLKSGRTSSILDVTGPSDTLERSRVHATKSNNENCIQDTDRFNPDTMPDRHTF